MFNWFKKLKESAYTDKMNKINYNNFVHDMQEYDKDEGSKFNQLGLILSKDLNKISMVIQLPENYAQYPDERLINLKIHEMMKPASDWILYTNNWWEYVVPPQVFHLEEADDDGLVKEGKNMSLTYVVVWEWEPQELPIKHWKAKLISCVTGSLAGLGAIITSLILFL